MLVIEIYNALKQAQLVSTLEEYSTQWLNKHKTTASYLIHKKRDLSINAKINCLKNINNKIYEIEHASTFQKELENQKFINLKNLLNLLDKDFYNRLNVKINI